jgi:putative endonuclease
MDKQYYVYIMTNFDNTVLYTGVTGNLIRRAHEHKNRLTDGFTKKYYTKKLVYFEV